MALSVAGAPAGVTAVVSDPALTGSSTTLTVSAAAVVTPGQYRLTVNGTGGGMARSGELFLTVTSSANGAFTLALAPAAVSLPLVSWGSVPSGTFLADYIGAVGAESDVLNHATFTATGAGAAAGFVLSVGADAKISSYTNVINPGAGCEPLITVHPTNQTPAATAAAAVGKKNVGTAGTSTVVYVGFSFENIGDGLATKTTKAELFDTLLAY